MCECDSDLVTEYLGSSFVIIQQEGEVRCWLCVCLSLSLSSTPGSFVNCVLVVQVMCECGLELVMEFPGILVVIICKRVREIKNEVSIRHIFFRTHHFCHMSRSLLVSSLVC